MLAIHLPSSLDNRKDNLVDIRHRLELGYLTIMTASYIRHVFRTKSLLSARAPWRMKAREYPLFLSVNFLILSTPYNTDASRPTHTHALRALGSLYQNIL